MTMKSSRTVTVLASLSLAAVGVPGIDTYLILASTEAAPAHTAATQAVINDPTETAINEVAVVDGAVVDVAVADVAPSAPEHATETVAAGMVTAGAANGTTSAVETPNVPGDAPGVASTPADLPATSITSTTTTLLCEVSLLALRNPRLHRELTVDGTTGYVIAAADTHPWSPASLRCDTTNTDTETGSGAGTGGTSIGRATNSAGAEVVAASVTSNGTLTTINETLLTTDATVLVEGSDVAVDGTGFVPGSTVDIWLHSDPVLLGNVTADSTGAFSTVLTLPTGVELGDHTIRTIGARAAEVAVALPVRIIANSPAVPAPEPATLTFVDGVVDINYIADQLWLRVNGIWVTRATTEPVELVPGDTLTAQVRNCDDTTCSPWVYSSYTLQVAAAPDIPTHSFTTDDGITGVFTVLSDAEEIRVIVDGVDTPGREIAVSNSAAIEVLARNCAGLAICSDWVRYDAIISKPAAPAVPDIRFVSTGPLAGTLDVTTEADDVEVTVNDVAVDDFSVPASGGDTMTVRARNCDDLCSSWVSAAYEVTVADVPDVPTITFTSLTSYTGQLDVDVAADEVEATLNDAVIEPVDVAVVGGDVLNVQARNCDGADVCSVWVDANHVVSVDAAPDPAELTFVSTGPYSGELGYSVTADEVVATFNDVDVTITNFAVVGGEVLRVEARNCDDAEICSDWVVATHTVSVAPDPDPAGLTYDTGAIKISNDTDVMEINHNSNGYSPATGAVSWAVDVDDTLAVRVRQCDGFNICSDWVDSNYLVTQADEPAAASIVFAPLTDITGHLVVTHDADEITMTLDGVAVTGEVVASGHQNLVVQVRDCDGHDVCSEWVESSYTVSVAKSPTAADITFARTTEFSGTLTVEHSAEEATLSLDGDTSVTSPMTVTGLEVLDVHVRNCASADVCSPWIDATREVTVAPIPTAPDIGFVTAGDYSRKLDATFTADRSEARLDGAIVTLPVTVTEVSTLVVEAWNCDGYDICSEPASSRDTYTVTVADSPVAALLTYDNGSIDIDSDADQMEINHNSAGYTPATGAVSWSVNVGDTLDVRVRNCDGHDLCAAWVPSSTYTVRQAAPAAAATFTFTSTGDYSANISISDNAEHVSVTVNGDTHEGLTVPVTGGEQIEVAVWDCTGFDECSEPVTSTYTVDVAPTPDPATIDFSSTGGYEDSGTLTVTQGDAEEIRQWFNNESTTDMSFTVTGGETLLVEVRNCGTATQICSAWVPAVEFVVTVDGAASAAILAFSKVDDDNGTIAVTYAADQIRLVRDNVEITGLSTPISVPVTAGQTLVAETRNCLNGRLCSAWTSSTYTVSPASQPAAPTLTFTSTDDYTGTVTIDNGNSYDRVEATRNGDSVTLDENFDVGVSGKQEVVGRVRGCSDGDLCSPWSSTTYTVTQATSTSTPTFTAARIGSNFDSVSTEITVDFGTVEEFEIFADSTSGTLLSDSSTTVTITKTDGYSSLVARSRNCAGSDVCSPWVDDTMNVTAHANPAEPVITLDENGFVVTADGDSNRSSFNSAAFVEASGNLTSVPADENDTLTVETRNCGDVNTWTFCSDVMSAGPALYVPAPQEATLTWDTSDYLLEVAFDATHIKIETGEASTIYTPETTYTKAEFEAAHPNGINCRPGWTSVGELDNCWMDIEVWNTSGSYSSLVVASDRFTLNRPSGPPHQEAFLLNVDVETGEVLSITPRLTPNLVDVITDLEIGGVPVPGSFTCEADSTCPDAFSSIIGNSYPAGTSIDFSAQRWTDGSNDVHIPYSRSAGWNIRATFKPTSSFGTLSAGPTGISQPYDGTPADDNSASSGTHKFEYSVDGGTTWVALPDVAGETISTNLNVGYDILYPSGVPVPSLDFRARYCAGSEYANSIFLCSDWSTVKSYSQAELTAPTPSARTLFKGTWGENGGHLGASGELADKTEYREPSGEWTTSFFGYVNTPGSYNSRQQNCGMAAGNCSSGGTNVFPSEWVYDDIEITQTPAPTVVLTPNTTGYTGANSCLETYMNGVAVQAYRHTIYDGSTTVDGNLSWCIGGFSDGDQVTAYKRHYDNSYDLASEETASAVYTVSQADHPAVTVNIDPLTGSTTLSSSTGSDVTFAYAIDNWVFTDYSGAFTVEADDWLRVRAYNCQPGKTLCGYTYELIVVTQAGTVPAAQLWFDITGGSNDFAAMYLDADPNYILTSFKVNSVEYLSSPMACVAEPSGIDPNTCLTDLDTTLGFGELMPGDELDYTLYHLGDAHLAGAATTSSVTLGAHSKDSLSLGNGETTADGFLQTLTGGWQVTGTLYGAFQYSTDGSNWTALPVVSTTTSSVADFVAEVPNSALYDNGNPVSDLHIRFRTCYSPYSDGHTFHYLATSDLCKDWQTTSYTQADLTGAAVTAPSLSWDNDNQTIAIANPADDIEYSTDGTNWTSAAFGTITTPGTYHVRHRTCGTANDVSCATGGINAFPSAWVTDSFDVGQATTPTVDITVDQTTEKASITTTAGTITYNIDGGTTTTYGAAFDVTVGTTVNASAEDCSLELCSVGTDSVTITRNDAPTVTINIDQTNGSTTLSAGTATTITYNLDSGATTPYGGAFTVVKGTNLTVTAIDCSSALCSGTTTETMTVTQADPPTVTISVNNADGQVTVDAPNATTLTYDTGTGSNTYSVSFTPPFNTEVTVTALDCSQNLCSTTTDTVTVTQASPPTVTITMSNDGDLVVTTDSATSNTEILYGWASSDVTNSYSAPLTTSDYTFGDTLYVTARSIDNANVWSTWTAVQSFDTIATAPTSAPVIDNNADFSELTFTSTASDVEYQINTSYDTSTQTAGWTEGTSATIRNGDIDHGDFGYKTETGLLADVSTRARNCANVNVEASCSAWVDDLNVTYGSEYVTAIGDSDDGVDTVAAANGEITFRMRFECAYDRCMPISNIQWSYEVDTDPVPGVNNFEHTDTFQIDRANPGAYVTPDAGKWTTEAVFVADDGSAVPAGQTAHWGTTAVVDTSGTVDLPVEMERIRWIRFFARWAGSPNSTYDDIWRNKVPGFDGNHSW